MRNRVPNAALRVLVRDYERWGDIQERLFIRARQCSELAQPFEELRLHHRQWVQRIFAREFELHNGSERARILVVSLDIGTTVAFAPSGSRQPRPLELQNLVAAHE